MEEELVYNCQGRKVTKYKESLKALDDDGDLFSLLPDSLLLHILSFLQMTDVINTSLLSKSWRYLWTSISCFDFETDNWKRKTDKVTFIDRSLFHYSGGNLHKLRILYKYKDADALQVDSWIYLAIRNNVEELELEFDGGDLLQNDWHSPRYKLPHSIYNCKSVTKLGLSFCDLNLSYSIQLSSLRELSLESLDLASDTLTFLTSNCPLLEHLDLIDCNRYSDLNIIIMNQNLKYLSIQEYGWTRYHTEVILFAPYLVDLGLIGCLPRKQYRLQKLKSLKDVSFEDCYEAPCYEIYGVHNVLVELLRDLYYVVGIRLCMFLVKVMSIRGVQEMYPLYFNFTYLELESELRRWELPGVSYILKSSPKLKTLIVYFSESTNEIKLGNDFKDKYAFEEEDYWDREEYNFSSTLQNLEFVDICFLSDTQNFNNTEGVIDKLKNKIEFAKFLLKITKALRKMIIRCGKNDISSSELIQKLSAELIALPRASLNARIDVV